MDEVMIIWKCVSCGWEYTDYPGYNEAQPCTRCGKACEEAGELQSG